jgi:hypothetical protein
MARNLKDIERGYKRGGLTFLAVSGAFMTVSALDFLFNLRLGTSFDELILASLFVSAALFMLIIGKVYFIILRKISDD